MNFEEDSRLSKNRSAGKLLKHQVLSIRKGTCVLYFSISLACRVYLKEYKTNHTIRMQGSFTSYRPGPAYGKSAY